MRVGGIAKGSGMIHPDMATMLSVVTCDAAVEPGLWRALFKRSAVKSFNQARRCGYGGSPPPTACLQTSCCVSCLLSTALTTAFSHMSPVVTSSHRVCCYFLVVTLYPRVPPSSKP